MLFPTLAVILASEENEPKSLMHGWKWNLCSGIFGTNVVFKNIQKLNLYDIFKEKSLYKSDYQIEVTVKEYFNYQGRGELMGELDNSFCIGLELIPYDDEFPKYFQWEAEEQKWTKVVLTKNISLKNVRYLKFIQEVTYGNLSTLDPGFPFGTYLPRATMKISFPMHLDKVIFHNFQYKCCFNYFVSSFEINGYSELDVTHEQIPTIIVSLQIVTFLYIV